MQYSIFALPLSRANVVICPAAGVGGVVAALRVSTIGQSEVRDIFTFMLPADVSFWMERLLLLPSFANHSVVIPPPPDSPEKYQLSPFVIFPVV